MRLHNGTLTEDNAYMHLTLADSEKLRRGELTMQEKYLEAELEIVRFEAEDVIATSTTLDENELPPIPVN